MAEIGKEKEKREERSRPVSLRRNQATLNKVKLTFISNNGHVV
jgi:hypothetical protein